MKHFFLLLKSSITKRTSIDSRFISIGTNLEENGDACEAVRLCLGLLQTPVLGLEVHQLDFQWEEGGGLGVLRPPAVRLAPVNLPGVEFVGPIQTAWESKCGVSSIIRLYLIHATSRDEAFLRNAARASLLVLAYCMIDKELFL